MVADGFAGRNTECLNASWFGKVYPENGRSQTIEGIVLPHNWDDYYGHRHLVHGELHGRCVYRRAVTVKKDSSARYFLVFVVSNAANFGLGQGTSLETTDEQFLSVLQVNVLGGFRLVQLAANRFFMRQDCNPTTGQRGVVVFVGSNSSERVNRNRITYVASKGAMDSMMKSFAVDLAPKGIRVNMVAPGFIWTNRWEFLSDEIKAQRRSLVPNGREATGKDVADAVLYLASDAARGFQGA